MLPQLSSDDIPAPIARTIFINPNFNKTRSKQNSVAVSQMLTTTKDTVAHFNPLFFKNNQSAVPAPVPAIHMNPNFLRAQPLHMQQLGHQQHYQMDAQALKNVALPNVTVTPIVNPPKICTNLNENAKIITKASRCLVRKPAAVQSYKKMSTTLTSMKVMPSLTAVQPLLSLTKRKLVRRAVDTSAVIQPPVTLKVKQVDKITTPTAPNIGKYKIDNRLKRSTGIISATPALVKVRRCDFVGRYALRRVSDQIASKNKANLSIANMESTSFSSVSLFSNRKLQLLNINGVLYKSTRNTLQRKDSENNSTGINFVKSKLKTNISVTSKSSIGRTLFVRGTKFVMDAKGFKLTRIPTNSASSTSSTDTRLSNCPLLPQRQQQRIHIGGLTYVASAQTNNVFVRSTNHLALAHVNSAKHRSLQLLTKRLVKSNVPCAIYQRVGKCIAYERGKCNKVHNKLQVTICPRFLRSECHNPKCLLSHNVSLSKMPACKFFLQGMCVRRDCPYLHKKLSSNAKICDDFLRGFCKLAEQCNKRHEFVCPEIERIGKCELSCCIHCKNKKRPIRGIDLKQTSAIEVKASKDLNEPAVASKRYFCGSHMEVEQQSKSPQHIADVELEHDNDIKMDAGTVPPFTFFGSRPKIGVLPSFIPLS